MYSQMLRSPINIWLVYNGDFNDPLLKRQLNKLKRSLQALLSAGSGSVRVEEVTPWNSVKIKLRLSRDAATKLRELAQQRNSSLANLGILSLEFEDGSPIHGGVADIFTIVETAVDSNDTAGCGPSSSVSHPVGSSDQLLNFLISSDNSEHLANSAGISSAKVARRGGVSGRRGKGSLGDSITTLLNNSTSITECQPTPEDIRRRTAALAKRKARAEQKKLAAAESASIVVPHDSQPERSNEVVSAMLTSQPLSGDHEPVPQDGGQMTSCVAPGCTDVSSSHGDIGESNNVTSESLSLEINGEGNPHNPTNVINNNVDSGEQAQVFEKSTAVSVPRLFNGLSPSPDSISSPHLMAKNSHESSHFDNIGNGNGGGDYVKELETLVMPDGIGNHRLATSNHNLPFDCINSGPDANDQKSLVSSSFQQASEKIVAVQNPQDTPAPFLPTAST